MVLDLPPKTSIPIDLEMNKAVDALLKRESELDITVEYLMENPAVPIGGYATFRRELGILKIDTAKQHINNLRDQQIDVVIFCYHKEVADTLAKFYKTEALTGDMAPTKRQIKVDSFQRDGGVIIGTYGGMGTGFTLTRSSHVVLVELDYSPQMIEQATDRCHRIGQSETVSVYSLLWKKGLERQLYQKLKSKSRVFSNFYEVNV